MIPAPRSRVSGGAIVGSSAQPSLDSSASVEMLSSALAGGQPKWSQGPRERDESVLLSHHTSRIGFMAAAMASKLFSLAFEFMTPPRRAKGPHEEHNSTRQTNTDLDAK